MARRKKPIKKRLRRIVPWGVAGMLLGVPISYQFQSGIVRTFVTRGQYTAKVFAAAPGAIWDQVQSGSGGSQSADPFGVIRTLGITVLVTTGLSLAIGWYLSRR